jgi:phosphocarrier protein NPr
MKVSATVTVINKLGLHARAATKLAKLSQQFSAKTTLLLGNNEADADSVLGLLLLSGAQGKEITVTSEGEDAEAALQSVCDLFTNKFDEEE